MVTGSLPGDHVSGEDMPLLTKLAGCSGIAPCKLPKARQPQTCEADTRGMMDAVIEAPGAYITKVG